MILKDATVPAGQPSPGSARDGIPRRSADFARADPRRPEAAAQYCRYHAAGAL
ncbi:MAG TPA: hypothetical protein VGI64_10505 [Streptosporangiaceae bacterium]|jgi:hypothetical protein